MTGCAYKILPARATEKQARIAYHGLMPSMIAMVRPTAGYQATNPMREKKTISGRFSKRYNSTNESETRAWRKIARRKYMNKTRSLSYSISHAEATKYGLFT